MRFVMAKRGPERATEIRQYDLLRLNVGQKEAPRLGSTICYSQEWARKSHQDSAVRLVTVKRWPEKATEIRRYGLLRPNVGQKELPRLGSTICYGQDWARKSHRNSVVRFVTAKSWPERGIDTRQYDLLRPRVGQKEPPRLGSTICGGQTWARKSHQDSTVLVTAKRGPPRLCSKIYYGQEELAKKSHRDSAVRFVTAKRGPERATKFRQYDLLRPNVGQKEPPRHGSTICYGQTWARKSYRDSAVRCVSAKRGPERAAKTRQYHFLPPNVGQNSRQDSAVRFVAAKSWPERATETRQYDLWRPNVGQKEPPRLGSTICYGQEELARKSRRDTAVRFVTAKRGPERATETRQFDVFRPNVGQKEPPSLGSTIYGQTWARKSYQNSAVRFCIFFFFFVSLLQPRVGHKEPPRLGSTICYGQPWARKSHRDSAVRFVMTKRGPERTTETRQYDLLRPSKGQKEPPKLGSSSFYGQELARKSHQDSAVRFVAAKSWPERATETRQYDLWRPDVGQKEPPRLGSKRGPERAIETRQYDLSRPNVGQKEPPRLGVTICNSQELARKSHRDSAVRFVTAKCGPERATETRQYDLLRPNVGQKEPPRLGSTICYCQELARKSHQDSVLRPNVGQKEPPRLGSSFFLRPRVGQKEPPRLGSTICYDQTWARKSHRDTAVRFVTAKRGPERATETRQFDVFRPNVGQKQPPRLGSSFFLRPRVGQKEPPRLGSTICYGQTWARKSHQDSAVRFVTTKRGPERAAETRQYDLLRPNVVQKELPRLGSSMCFGQTWARKSHRVSAVQFTAKRGPERATKIRQYDLLRPRRVGQKEPPRLGNTICYRQTWARKTHRDSAVRFVTAKRGPERATEIRQYEFLRPRVGQKESPRLGSTICYG